MTATIKSDRDARAENAFFGVESEINDLRHMAQIAADLAGNVSGLSADRRTFTIDYDELERIQFAVGQTLRLAVDLVEAFRKEFEEGERT